MKWATFAFGIVSVLLTVMTGLIVQGSFLVHVASSGTTHEKLAVIVYGAAAMALLGSIMALFRPRFAAWCFVIASVVGVFGAFDLWMFPGSVLFVSMIMAFVQRTEQTTAGADKKA
ncbi:hypothetical protein [Ferroacidibacillus organovorans]|uniref:DUF4064 domain-containing protein n=1 Tax=Ferroacidibacillus organovorans TaxID=1765683 RepID=A0A162TTS9_9BACL|nr:hypothetical protein [Ferroacidibacillus organovorans]KYP81122.1 hypothetical protein AYJ22_08555 [Ferroacidibacillus organovorans]OAG92223.1 hypothetical protein AYW79_13310 [Ferroacidibacillus organovorans]OPG16327.1 hypothetical protein B2M26_05430 [Ferroacidibacillus organovorans]